MAAPQQRLGRRAEEAAAAWLSSRGWRVLARRWRSAVGRDRPGLPGSGRSAGRRRGQAAPHVADRRSGRRRSTRDAWSDCDGRWPTTPRSGAHRRRRCGSTWWRSRRPVPPGAWRAGRESISGDGRLSRRTCAPAAGSRRCTAARSGRCRTDRCRPAPGSRRPAPSAGCRIGPGSASAARTPARTLLRAFHRFTRSPQHGGAHPVGGRRQQLHDADGAGAGHDALLPARLLPGDRQAPGRAGSAGAGPRRRSAAACHCAAGRRPPSRAACRPEASARGGCVAPAATAAPRECAAAARSG